MFKKDKVYPCDDTGPYIEIDGPIVSVDIGNLAKVTIDSKYGYISGYCSIGRDGDMLQRSFIERANWATIRVYNSGYETDSNIALAPDNHVMNIKIILD